MPISNSNQAMLPFSQEELQQTKDLIGQVKDSLTFMKPVTDEQVKSAAKLDDMRESFIRDVITEMTNAKGTIPTLANLEKLVAYYAFYGFAYDIEDILKELLTFVTRERMVYGGKAYDQASRHYKGLDTAIKDEAEGAAESKKRLAKYFTSKNNNGDDKVDKGSAEKSK